MKLQHTALVALLALLTFSSNSAALVIESEVDANIVAPGVKNSTIETGVDDSFESLPNQIWNGHNITRGAAMQWCHVSSNSVTSHIIIWGRNWPEENLGPNGEKLKARLKKRCHSLTGWRFERCHPDTDYCMPKVFKGYQWRARAVAVTWAGKLVEKAIGDVSPAVNQAFEAGKTPGHGLCSIHHPPDDPVEALKGKHRWESEIEE